MEKNVQNRGRRPPDNQQKQRLKIIKWVLLVLLLAFIIKGCYTTYFDKEESDRSLIVGDIMPDNKDAFEMSDEDIMKRAQDAADKSTFNLMVYPKATFSSRSGKGTFKVKNPKSNHYPISVNLCIKETSSVVYTSGAIYPGEEINSVTLDQMLDAGNYEMTAEVSVYNADTKLKQGFLSAEVSVTVTP